jgi:hypothetical protein
MDVRRTEDGTLPRRAVCFAKAWAGVSTRGFSRLLPLPLALPLNLEA